MSNADAPSPHVPSDPDLPPILMTISRGQAGIMAAFGVGLLFCAFLLGVLAFRAMVPMWVRVGLGLTALYVGWVGVAMISGAIAGTKQPVLTLHADRIVSHGEPGGDWSAPLSAIVSRRYETRTGVKALVLEFAEGRKIAIPETLVGADGAFARLGVGAGEAPEA